MKQPRFAVVTPFQGEDENNKLEKFRRRMPVNSIKLINMMDMRTFI
ncbi:MAG: hypothetical protein K9M99_05040 [Candidatus Cloacimonetes bacterium]|nr:hypothetical protein [Candidatus Cloacimonadota bacterium]